MSCTLCTFSSFRFPPSRTHGPADMVQSVSPAWIAEVNSGVVDNYIAGATFVLIVYEYFITFGAEVELFWRKKITGSSVLFFPNRYLVLLYQLFQLRKQRTFSDLSGYDPPGDASGSASLTRTLAAACT
ncbi:hypothetical protein LXA43DRAFT_82931, partial [Ganoderma leucocontextum]